MALIDELNGNVDVALERYSNVITLLEAEMDSWLHNGISTHYSELELLQEALIDSYVGRATLYKSVGSLSLRDADLQRLSDLGVDPNRVLHLR